ncbi:oligopeptide ABC transporter substrate-binding protein [Lactobacillus delbrueckii subsp. lactis]|uniref:oligopeptide ABC transporter substrate-binding protein n=1 Tax=Lactobacillus delbrueckii TaxID=1584 RepID=UPI0011097551|nr:oligopeptide ABC transporter substrate-binding protein [Lactobacillus delbrueckii]MBO1192440.1 oligopeptide ABC transporter substrate-binding protein [Lactobacillus delbrueckii subsp. lactis]MCD5544126.1 oligopeptide ABC transporter substrate-binding protein [Lactobacillus delbrueckii subsp. lactis]MCD5552306.1 oligopeptide ABC transporter substrate-binding protein [Lactobacillus delbrueckii subsp. lactis]MCD5553241.1 oligopeptide ABC transporter substrate-binding protein [Lactobacillus delb
MKRRMLGTFGVLLAGAALLAGCGKSSSSSSDSNSGAKDVKKFPEATATATAKKGGSVTVAEEVDTPVKGVFSNELSDSAPDSDFMAFGNEGLFATDDQYKINNKGAATFKMDRQAKTVTIEVKKGVKWSDGKQVTAKDVEYSYEIIANKASQSSRYTSSLADIVGLAEYHDGKSKKISGIEMPDGENGRKVVLHFKEMKPGMTQSGNGFFWEYAAPYHYLKDVPFSKLQSSDKVRKNPLFFGPYKLSKLVRGQSATWVRNPYYYRGKAKLDKITISVISPNSASQSIKSKKFDMIDVVNSQWKEVKGTKGYNFVAQIPLQYSYMGFKVGKWDKKTGSVKMNKNSKMSNRYLRQAMGYAMNVDEVTQHYTQGLSFRVKTLVPEGFGDFHDKSVKGFPLNIKKANALLDKAGYKKKKGETYRRDPNGNKLTIHLAAMSGSPNQEAIVQNYIQQWKKIGLHVTLTTGRLLEFNSFYDKVKNDDPSVDVFMAAWGLSSEPTQDDLYGPKAPFNFTRFATSENTKLLKEMGSDKAFNHSYRVQKFHEWQQYMQKEAFVIPLTNAYKITAVNSKLVNYSTKPSKLATLWYETGFKK